MIILTNGNPPPMDDHLFVIPVRGNRNAGITSSHSMHASELHAGFPAALSTQCAHLSGEQDLPTITAILPPPARQSIEFAIPEPLTSFHLRRWSDDLTIPLHVTATPPMSQAGGMAVAANCRKRVRRDWRGWPMPIND